MWQSTWEELHRRSSAATARMTGAPVSGSPCAGEGGRLLSSSGDGRISTTERGERRRGLRQQTQRPRRPTPSA
jgi:hypothetical protein